MALRSQLEPFEQEYPRLLAPTTTEPVHLPASASIQVPKATPIFLPWSGHPIVDTYGEKEVLTWRDRPAFAELVILWALNSVGWEGVWIDTYGHAYRKDYWGCPATDLPPEQAALMESIYKKAGSRSGAWDVFCWRGKSVLFAESKRAKHDGLRKSQLRWLDAALSTGLQVRDFLIVEWSIRSD
jgi:hypothetical protein